MKVLITRKLGMTSAINEDGATEAITLLSVGEHTVTHHKNEEKDGYTAVQVGAEKAKKLGKSLAGHLKTAKVMPKIIREFRISEIPEDLNVGAKITADVFSVGDSVHVTGTSKGKGWAGTIKRHNFHRGRKTHGGQSYRRPGSIGSMYPQHILKGKKMAGRMGHDQVTVRNLKVAIVDMDHNVIGVTGAVPGPRKSVVILKGAK
ncbi:MAG TPA: 50S ribosomal protein L3 [Candidatus Saccharimonadales bacterium]|nr:50S ribosomal protein L3 [Candidatus Saccharimonadales bacterium]